MAVNLLVVSQYFWPESFIINDVVRTLVAQGHQVEVLTGKPNYPDGEVFEGYTATGCAQEIFAEGALIHRVPLRPRGRGGAKNLALNYISFVINGIRYFPQMVSGKRFDAILVFAPSPITAAIPAIWLKRRLRNHLAIWIQDLWPESLSATGYVRNRALLTMVGWMVNAIYACADTLLVQSRGFLAPMSRRTPLDRIVYYPNSYADPAASSVAESLLPSLLSDQLRSNDCIVFAGNIGTAQAVGTLLEAAIHLQRRPGFKMVIVGSGSMLDWLENEIGRRGVTNIVLAGRLPPSSMPALFSRAVGLVVTLNRAEIFSQTIPSKIQAYMAAGRPIIAALDGEGARVIEEAGAGMTCPAEDAVALAGCMNRLLDMPSPSREVLGQAGRRYYLEHFEMEKLSQRLVDILAARGVKGQG